MNAARAAFKLPGFERLAYWVAAGHSPKSWRGRIPPNNYQYSSPAVRLVQRSGIRYKLDLRDYTEWAVYFGLHDISKDRLYDLASPGATVLDVGANMGETAMNLASRVGPAGRVFAFEPFPATFDRLRGNLELNSFCNVEIFPVAIGATRGHVTFSTFPANAGQTRVSSLGEQTSEVGMITLDDFVTEFGVPRVDLIKLDTEGYELHAVQGAGGLLSRDSPTLFVEVCEENLRAAGHTPRELVSYLEEINYRCYRAEDYAPVLSRSTDFSACHFDVVAVKAGKGDPPESSRPERARLDLHGHG